MKEYSQNELIGSILSAKRLVQPRVDVVIDPRVAAEVAHSRFAFETSTPDGRTMITQDLAFRLNLQAGARMPDETELLSIIANQLLKNRLTEITDREIAPITKTFNAIWRFGLKTVGDLRQTNIEALVTQKKNLLALYGLNIEKMIFAQAAFRKPEPTQPKARP